MVRLSKSYVSFIFHLTYKVYHTISKIGNIYALDSQGHSIVFLVGVNTLCMLCFKTIRGIIRSISLDFAAFR